MSISLSYAKLGEGVDRWILSTSRGDKKAPGGIPGARCEEKQLFFINIYFCGFAYGFIIRRVILLESVDNIGIELLEDIQF